MLGEYCSTLSNPCTPPPSSYDTRSWYSIHICYKHLAYWQLHFYELKIAFITKIAVNEDLNCWNRFTGLLCFFSKHVYLVKPLAIQVMSTQNENLQNCISHVLYYGEVSMNCRRQGLYPPALSRGGAQGQEAASCSRGWNKVSKSPLMNRSQRFPFSVIWTWIVAILDN